MAKTPTRRVLFVTALTALLLLALVAPAGAFPRVPRWWQYDMTTWTQTWHSVPSLVHLDRRWEKKYPDATRQEVRAFHDELTARYRSMHFHRAAGVQTGVASIFKATHGYCTKHMTGYYAASKTLPCGTQVSVRAGDRYVIVTIEDRGPYVPGRILDLSGAAFKQLAPLGSGVIHVTATRLKP